MATPKEGNPLWMLRTFYFVPCDLMYQHMMSHEADFFSDNERKRDRIAELFIAYMLYWFAGLFVVAEGWKELKVREPIIDKMIDQHWDSLRLFRNAVFHFHSTDRKHVQFFSPDKFNWAQRLHHALRDFFAAQDT